MPADAVSAPACPHADLGRDFKPFDLADPFPFYARARARGADLLQPRDRLLGGHALRGHPRDLPRPGDVLLGEHPVAVPARPAEVQRILDDGGFSVVSGLSGHQPPDHTRLRGFIKKAFTPRRVASLEPEIRAIADRA